MASISIRMIVTFNGALSVHIEQPRAAAHDGDGRELAHSAFRPRHGQLEDST